MIQAMQDTLPSINGKPAGPKVDPMSHPRKVKGFLRSENQPPTCNSSKIGGMFAENGRNDMGNWFWLVVRRVQDGNEGFLRESQEGEAQHRHLGSSGTLREPEGRACLQCRRPPPPFALHGWKIIPSTNLHFRRKPQLLPEDQKGITAKLLPPKNFPAPDGVIWHLLLPVSNGWGSRDKARFEIKTLTERIGKINEEGGLVSLTRQSPRKAKYLARYSIPYHNWEKDCPKLIANPLQASGTCNLNFQVKAFLVQRLLWA